MADNDGVAFGSFQHHRPLFDGAYSKDSHLWLVDDGGTHKAAERTDIGQGKGAALRVFRPQLVLAGVVCGGVYLPGKAVEVGLVGIMDKRDDGGTGWPGWGHADIGDFFHDDF